MGKTWLVREFGQANFEKTAYVTFQENLGMMAVFAGSLEPQRLLEAIEVDTGVRIDPQNTLVVFDEIQECPRALTALKMFNEQCPGLAIVAAGSLLGVALHQGISFPVGKVEHLDLYPLTFTEFLLATGDSALVELLKKRDFSLITAFREKYIDALKRYYFIGGMPEAVQLYVDKGDYQAARDVHQRLLYDYEHDFSKYAAGDLAERIRLVWDSAPAQLAKENRKFIYSALKPGARARSYEVAIQWLVDSGLLLRVNRVIKPGLPLKGYQDIGAFKLFLLDIGLLGAASGLQVSTLIQGNGLFSEFKGALTEQYVCQQMLAENRLRPYYWSADNSRGEVDLLYEQSGDIYPVEVKAEENLRSRSLKAFVDRYPLTKAIRISMADYKEQDWLTNIPLYAVSTLARTD
ncbi:MAG: ATP-binding protein [Coriobacteriia bacterium]|nr:ATP-binding protein [Coriobacteriia bacterium]